MHIKDECKVAAIDEYKTIHKVVNTALNKYKVRMNNQILMHSYLWLGTSYFRYNN